MSIVRTYKNCKEEKVNLQKVKLVKDTWGYFLDMTYQVETPERIEEVHLPRVRVPINTEGFILRTDYGLLRPTTVVDVGFGDATLYPDKNQKANVYYTIETKEIKTKEMTLDEIEEKLGHKVKIVNK